MLEAFNRMEVLEASAKVQLLIEKLGGGSAISDANLKKIDEAAKNWTGNGVPKAS